MLSSDLTDKKINDFSTYSTKELFKLLNKAKQEKKPIKDINQLRYIRDLNQYTQSMTEKWKKKIDNLTTILHYGKEKRLYDEYCYISIASKSDPETAYIEACNQYADHLIKVISYSYTTHRDDSLEHIQHCYDLTILPSLIANHFWILEDITEKNDIAAFYKKYFENNRNFFQLIFKSALGKHDNYDKRLLIVLKRIILALPLEVILENLTPSIKDDHYRVYIAYELEKRKALKAYTQQELTQLKHYILQEFDNYSSLESKNEIYEKYKNMSYFTNDYITEMQQQLYDIVANEAKFNGLITAIESCSAAKACSIFTIDSPITQKLHKLGDILKTLLQEESCSYKRKR